MNKLHSTEYKKAYQFNYGLIGLLGLLLPFLDVWKCGGKIPSSISISYYQGAIAPFVLILGGLGLILFCNHGFDQVDKWCNRIAGLAALGVICFPCNGPGLYPTIHYVSAVILFLTFAFMCFVFTGIRSQRGTTRNKEIRNIIYKTCGVLILVGFPVAYRWTFWGEVWMLYAYGIAYLIQAKIILKD